MRKKRKQWTCETKAVDPDTRKSVPTEESMKGTSRKNMRFVSRFKSLYVNLLLENSSYSKLVTICRVNA